MNLISPESAQWKEIECLFGVGVDTTNGLHTSNLTNQVKLGMLLSWYNNEATLVTCSNVISVLEGPLKNKSIANEIHTSLRIKPIS